MLGCESIRNESDVYFKVYHIEYWSLSCLNFRSESIAICDWHAMATTLEVSTSELITVNIHFSINQLFEFAEFPAAFMCQRLDSSNPWKKIPKRIFIFSTVLSFFFNELNIAF